MRQKKIFHSEAAYIPGILILAAGTAFMERADFGMSMVVASAYLLHLKISQYLPIYSFGMSEYCLQEVVLVILSLCMGRFRKYYLFSFVTAVLYGFALDGAILALGCVHLQGLAWRTVCYILGLPLCSLGVAFLFHTKNSMMTASSAINTPSSIFPGTSLPFLLTVPRNAILMGSFNLLKASFSTLNGFV